MSEKEIHEFCMQLAEKGIERYNTDNGYTIIKDSAISREIQKARIEELERLKNEYTQYAWARNPANLPGLANPFRLVDDRIKQLEDER